MNTRRADFELDYNGSTVDNKMLDYKTGVVYSDPASGEADSIDISLQDRKQQWMTAWMPISGDTIEASIKLTDWEREGDNRILDCGFFILDDFSFSGWPATGTISGVSTPSDDGFMETQRSKTWEKVTIKEIAAEISARAGLSLVYDIEAKPFVINSIEQSEQPDCEFLAKLCETYGYSMKVYARKIVIFDREQYKKKPTVGIVYETDLASWSWNKTLTGTYTGGEFTYTDPSTEEEIAASVGTGTRILKKSGKADSRADAERQITASVNEANHGAVTMSITIMGNAKWVASQCITVTGIGKLSGKYYIDQITHAIGQGYQMSLELSQVENMSAEVVHDAIERLVAVKVISTPSYWLEHYKDVNQLDGLLLNMATRIKVNLGGSAIKDVSAALDVLTREGVINSPGYWSKKHTALKWLDVLIINAANAMTKPEE